MVWHAFHERIGAGAVAGWIELQLRTMLHCFRPHQTAMATPVKSKVEGP